MNTIGAQAASPSADGAATTIELRAELWRFALAFYGRAEVAKACLALQERLGADVDIILFALFALSERGISLRAEEVREVDTLVADWRAEIVRPLRQIRTRLKSGPCPAPSSETEALRERAKWLEIDAERVELYRLADWLAQRGNSRGNAYGPGEFGALFARIAAHFAGTTPALLDAPDVREALDALATAARIFAGAADA
jgi:uncharacterized protein (TIGR02444 family)